MKSKSFIVLLSVLGTLSLVSFILYGTLPSAVDENGYWHSFLLGVAIVLLFVVGILLAMFFLGKEKPIPIEKRIECPRCHTSYPADEDYCPGCGEKNPEYREKKPDYATIPEEEEKDRREEQR